MDLQAWRGKRNQTEDVEVGGLKIKCKRVALMDLAANGQIPTPLLGVVQEISNSGQSGAFQLNVTELPQITDLVNLIAKLAAVEPKIEDEPSETALGINELSFTERMAIFTWANGTATALAPFPAQPTGDLPAA
jgi:hypothetical protein